MLALEPVEVLGTALFIRPPLVPIEGLPPLVPIDGLAPPLLGLPRPLVAVCLWFAMICLCNAPPPAIRNVFHSFFVAP